MKWVTAFSTVVIILLAGTNMIQNENTCDLITVTSMVSPSPVVDEETSTLRIEINPQKDFDSLIGMMIVPQDPAVLTITGKDLSYEEGKYFYFFSQRRQTKGDPLTVTFNVKVNCNCKTGKWTIHILVIAGEECVVRELVPFVVRDETTIAKNVQSYELLSVFIYGAVLVVVSSRWPQKRYLTTLGATPFLFLGECLIMILVAEYLHVDEFHILPVYSPAFKMLYDRVPWVLPFSHGWGWGIPLLICWAVTGKSQSKWMAYFPLLLFAGWGFLVEYSATLNGLWDYNQSLFMIEGVLPVMKLVFIVLCGLLLRGADIVVFRLTKKKSWHWSLLTKAIAYNCIFVSLFVILPG